MSSVALVMIVKDEEQVIVRALASAIPFINSWLIVDTGSTDNTKFIIKKVLADISGELVDRPWVNFGYNRTEALQLCRARGCTWAIMLDADDNLAGTVPPPSIWSNTNLDGFVMQIHHGTIIHQRVHIFHLASDWVYEGVVHEYPRCRTKDPPTLGVLPPETFMETRCEGARSKDPNKYLKDAALLETELLHNPTNGRTLFYLAQSYRDAGRLIEAQRYYKQHIDLSGSSWAQESYMSLVNLIGLSSDVSEIMNYGWRALELCPDRLEASYFLMNRLRLLGHKPTQQLFALGAVVKERKASRSSLFVNQAIYKWGYDDEFAVVAFATGHYTESYAASTRCAINAPAAEMRENALKNLKITQELLSQRA